MGELPWNFGNPKDSLCDDDSLTKPLSLAGGNHGTSSAKSASARITQALKVNDIGTAQRIAASAAMMTGQFQKQALNQPPTKVSDHRLDVWA